MRWVMQQNSGSIHYWELQRPGGNVKIKFNYEAHTIRLNSSSRRMFFVEKGGLFRTRVRLLSEYGIPIGEAHFTEHLAKGVLHMNGEKSYFTIGQHLMTVTDAHGAGKSEAYISHTTYLDEYEILSILLSFAWIVDKDRSAVVA